MEKEKIQVKIGIALQNILRSEKDAEAEGHKAVTSLRKLAAAAGIEYSLLQKISSGKKNPALTTLVGIADAFDMTMRDFFATFDAVTQSEMHEFTGKPDKKKKKDSKK